MKRLSWIVGLPASFCAALIRFYQVVVSPWKPRCCRFVPSCSEYAKQAYLMHGFWRGSCLTVWRLMRCHPFYHGAVYDPVPSPKNHG